MYFVSKLMSSSVDTITEAVHPYSDKHRNNKALFP